MFYKSNEPEWKQTKKYEIALPCSSESLVHQRWNYENRDQTEEGNVYLLLSQNSIAVFIKKNKTKKKTK